MSAVSPLPFHFSADPSTLLAAQFEGNKMEVEEKAVIALPGALLNFPKNSQACAAFETIQSLDQMLNTLTKQEEIIKGHEALKVFLLTQQQLMRQLWNNVQSLDSLNTAQSLKLIEQTNEIEGLKKQLASKTDSHRFKGLEWISAPIIEEKRGKKESMEDTPVRLEQERVKPEEAYLKTKVWQGEFASYELERQRKAEKERSHLMLLQNELVKACEVGDEKWVSKLLEQGAESDTCNEQGIYPLGAAVWGMNPEVVDLVIANTKTLASMTWKECEEHNLKVYKEVFMFKDFAPHTYGDWYTLLLKMGHSPFLAAKHLAEADRVWHDSATSSLGNFVSWVRGEDRRGKSSIRGGLSIFVIKATKIIHSNLMEAITQRVYPIPIMR